MAPLPLASFRACLQDLDPPALAAFVAALWAARGYETTVEGRSVLVRHPGRGGRRLLVVRPERSAAARVVSRVARRLPGIAGPKTGTATSTGHTDAGPSGDLAPPDPGTGDALDAGAVETVSVIDVGRHGTDRRGRRGAGRGESSGTGPTREGLGTVDRLDAEDLYRVALYGIDREECDRLFREHLGRPVAARPDEVPDGPPTGSVAGAIPTARGGAGDDSTCGGGTAGRSTPVGGGPTAAGRSTNARRSAPAGSTTAGPTTAEPTPSGSRGGDGDPVARSAVAVAAVVAVLLVASLGAPALPGTLLGAPDGGGGALPSDASTGERPAPPADDGVDGTATPPPTRTPGIADEVAWTNGTRPPALRSGPSGSGADWITFGYDAARTGHNPHARGPGPSAAVAETLDVGSPLASAPAVVDGRLLFGTVDGTVHGANASPMRLGWRRSLGRGITATPAVAEGTVFIGTLGGRERDGSVARNFYALGAVDGTTRWGTSDPSLLSSSPAVANGTVYLAGTEGTVYARRATTGDRRWVASVPDPVQTAPAVADGTVYVGSVNGSVVALDAATGARRWTTPVEGAVLAAPAVADGTLYAATAGGTLHALDAGTGRVRWTRDVGSVLGSSPAVANGTVFVAGQDSRVTALDASTGTVRWRVLVDGPVRAPPAVANGTVFVGSQSSNVYAGRTASTVYALDAATGAERWTVQTNGSVTAGPVVVGRSLYVGDAFGTLYRIGPCADRDGNWAAVPGSVGNRSVAQSVTCG